MYRIALFHEDAQTPHAKSDNPDRGRAARTIVDAVSTNPQISIDVPSAAALLKAVLQAPPGEHIYVEHFAASCPAGLYAIGEPGWTFYSPDSDRSSGWTNHCFVMQTVCFGYGLTAEEALRDAARTREDEFDQYARSAVDDWLHPGGTDRLIGVPDAERVEVDLTYEMAREPAEDDDEEEGED